MNTALYTTQNKNTTYTPFGVSVVQNKSRECLDIYLIFEKELSSLRGWLLPMLMNGQVKVTSAKASATKVGEALQKGEVGMAAEG